MSVGPPRKRPPEVGEGAAEEATPEVGEGAAEEATPEVGGWNNKKKPANAGFFCYE